jgi:hypothetical protein
MRQPLAANAQAPKPLIGCKLDTTGINPQGSFVSRSAPACSGQMPDGPSNLRTVSLIFLRQIGFVL